MLLPYSSVCSPEGKFQKPPSYPPQIKDFASQPKALAAPCAVSRSNNSGPRRPRQQPDSLARQINIFFYLDINAMTNHLLTARELKNIEGLTRKRERATALSWLISAGGEPNRRLFPINTHQALHPRIRQVVVLFLRTMTQSRGGLSLRITTVYPLTEKKTIYNIVHGQSKAYN